MQIRIENPNGEQAIEDYQTDRPITVRTAVGVVTVGTFADDSVLVVRVTGDRATTLIKFNEDGLI